MTKRGVLQSTAP